nr:hypothetical protein [Tanacetum cinerariifolium]
MLYRDRRDDAQTGRLIETEARLLHQALVQSMDASDLAHSEVMALHAQHVMQTEAEMAKTVMTLEWV